MTVVIGIDVAKDKHDCFILNSEGEILEDVFTHSKQHGRLHLSIVQNPILYNSAGQNKSRA